MRTNNDDDGGRSRSPVRSETDATYTIASADWDDSGAARHGLTARAESAGFSPVRFNKGRQHTLDVDPRTKLKIINVPAERRVAFADLQDVVLHVFVDCNKITTSDQHAERVLIVTDQSLFLCTKDGSVSRCLMVDRINRLAVSSDNRALGIIIESEYDMLVRFQQVQDRDRVIKVLRTVYRRLAHDRLKVELQKKAKFDPLSFKIDKPDNFRLTLIPQRTREQLREALELFEQEEEAMLEEIDMIQDEMEDKHQNHMMDMQAQLEQSLQKLKDIVREVWDNEGRLTKLRDDVAKGRRMIEQVDGGFGPDGELPVSKDAQISELELIVARLNAAVYASGSEQTRKGDADNAVTFFQKDLQEQLYQPSWPGSEVVHDLSSLSKALSEKIVSLNDEIRQMQSVIEDGKATEAKLQYVTERIAYLKHLQRTGNFNARTARAMDSAANAMSAAQAAGQTAGSKDGTRSYLADLPREITVDTITADPRTGLVFAEVPDSMRSYFHDLNDAVLHFFAVVKKQAHTGELVKRIVLISHTAMYLTTPNGVVKRCMNAIDINEILLDSQFGVGFKNSADYDLTFVCTSGEHRQEMVDILQKIYRFESNGRAIPITMVPKHQRIEGFLRLNPPSGYVLQVTPFLKRQELVDAIRQRRDIEFHNAPLTATSSAAVTVPSDIKMSEEQYIRLRQDVAKIMDNEWRQDATLVKLRAELDNIDKQVQAATDESHFLKRQIDSHRCEEGVGLTAGSYPVAPGSGILPSTGPGTYRPSADGLFFIKVEPVQINCELDIQKVCFNDEYVFTGHANGFVNIWDMKNGKHPLLRTLREHTGKVTSMSCTPVTLLTSSMDSTIRLWDLRNGRATHKFVGHNGPVNSVHCQGKRIVSGGADTIVRVWDHETGKQVKGYKGHKSQIIGVKFEQDILVSVEWGWVLFWDLRTEKVIRTLRDELGGIRSFDFADGVVACGGCGGDLTIWDVSKGTGETISGHDDDILHVQLAGRAAITSGGDYKIKMWDVVALKSLGTFYDCHPFEPRTFQMEDKTFVCGAGQYAKLWVK